LQMPSNDGSSPTGHCDGVNPVHLEQTEEKGGRPT
jgi:hypothetical protein